MIIMAAFFTIIALIGWGIVIFLYTPKGKRWLDEMNH